jgi:hypothetical protein
MERHAPRTTPRDPTDAARRRTAGLFNVGIRCAIKRAQRMDANLDVAPARFDGPETSPLATRDADLRAWVAERPEISRAEWRAKREDPGTGSSPAAIARCLQRLGPTRKKTGIAAERSRNAIAEGRRDWRRRQPGATPGHSAFVDENRPPTTMARHYGRGPTGERAAAIAPPGYWQATALSAALRHDRITASAASRTRLTAPPSEIG